MILNFILIFFTTWAADKEVPVAAHGFANQTLELHSQMDEDAQKAVKEFLAFSECSYESPNYRKENQDAKSAKPEIFSVPACGKDSSTPPITYCASYIRCVNRNTNYKIADAFCKSLTPTSCPPAKDCALASHITRSLGSDDDSQTSDGKQHRILQQDRRGWSPSHVNRYSWTIADEVDMDALEKEHASKTTKPSKEDE